MCAFFSFISNGRGVYRYFDQKLRKQIIAGQLTDKRGNVIESAEKWVRALDFSGIVPELVIKSIVLPFEGRSRPRLTDRDSPMKITARWNQRHDNAANEARENRAGSKL